MFSITTRQVWDWYMILGPGTMIGCAHFYSQSYLSFICSCCKERLGLKVDIAQWFKEHTQRQNLLSFLILVIRFLGIIKQYACFLGGFFWGGGQVIVLIDEKFPHISFLFCFVIPVSINIVQFSTAIVAYHKSIERLH